MKKKFLCIFSILLLILSCFMLSACKDDEDYSLPEGRDEDGTIRIFYDDEVLGSVTVEQILDLNSKTKKISYQSSSAGGTISGEFQGAQFADIIKLVDEDILNDYDSLKAFGSDGYFSEISMDEVRQLNNVFIMYSKDGEILPVYKGDAERSFRLIVTNDKFGIRFTNYLVDIILEKEEE